MTMFEEAQAQTVNDDIIDPWRRESFPRCEEVVLTKTVLGTGKENDPFRAGVCVHSKTGSFIASHDPYRADIISLPTSAKSEPNRTSPTGATNADLDPANHQ